MRLKKCRPCGVRPEKILGLSEKGWKELRLQCPRCGKRVERFPGQQLIESDWNEIAEYKYDIKND